MNWSVVGKEIVKLGAPLLGFIIGGPAGSAATEVLENVFNAKSGDNSDLMAKIKSDPDAKIKLAKIEADHSIELQRILFDYQAKLYEYDKAFIDQDTKDVQDARRFEEQTHSIMPHVVTIGLGLMIIGVLALFFLLAIPDDNREIIIGITILLSYLFMLACRYWIGGAIPTIDDIEKIRHDK